MAKQVSAPKVSNPTNNGHRNAIPTETDMRAELFFLLGCIHGAGVDSSARIAELVIKLTAPATPEVEAE